MEKPVFFPAISPFSMQVAYVDIDSHSSLNQFEHHIHPECEIYLNLSGDVSFMVEDRIYPITAGSVIITRPHEYHHCIYHSDKRHRHYWILFSSENNEKWLKLFFDRPHGENNLLRIVPSKLNRLGLAMELLKNGSSVTDACFNSGFFDCSKFISFFKKNVGMTPLQYKKNRFSP